MRLIRHKKLVSAMAFMAITHAGYARSQPSGAKDRSRLLSASAGSELVDVALRYQPEDAVKPDCSHLVYEIYRQAGLNFRFASSRELYAGVDPFQRVRRPQAGDLIVWHGHVGIVVNPREHSFYSSLRGGLTTDYYNAVYWTSRGMPRFYRYRVSAQGPAASPRLMRAAHRAGNANDAQKLESVAAPPREVIVPNRDSSQDTRSRFLIAQTELPEKPTAEDFRSALIHHIDDTGSALESNRSVDASASVLVVDDVAVEKLKLRKDQGSLEIRLDCSVAIDNGQVTANPVSQKRKLNLQRSNAGWLVEDENAPLYVPRQTALRVFASQLAMATHQDGRDEDVARLLRVLNVLAPEK
jgi:hypothetical protein